MRDGNGLNIYFEALYGWKREWWKKTRKRILKRDHYTCQRCGSHKNLQVHHKKLYDEQYDEEFVTLCRKCHMELHPIHIAEENVRNLLRRNK